MSDEKKSRRILAIETSCDDTSVSIVALGGFVEALLSANQDLVHQPFGGVVPEIASRNHTLHLLPLIEKILLDNNRTWDDIDGLAVTNRPGLMGSLLVGVVTAKTLSQAWSKPLIGVNHLEGHILAPFLSDKNFKPAHDLQFPFVALAVSGGHTTIYEVQAFGKYKVLGATLDDAAGEAWDKFGKMLGLGFPGGVLVDRESKNGDAKAFNFPRGLILEDHLNMSFSGLKSSAQRLIQSLSPEEIKNRRADLCASFQEAVVDVLLAKLDKAMKKTRLKSVVITGGVSANSRLRERAQDWATQNKYQLSIPPLRFCTDNAAMIGFVGMERLQRGEIHDMSLAPSPSPWTGDFLA